jgi:hypothetical protein
LLDVLSQTKSSSRAVADEQLVSDDGKDSQEAQGHSHFIVVEDQKQHAAEAPNLSAAVLMDIINPLYLGTYSRIRLPVKTKATPPRKHMMKLRITTTHRSSMYM